MLVNSLSDSIRHAREAVESHQQKVSDGRGGFPSFACEFSVQPARCVFTKPPRSAVQKKKTETNRKINKTITFSSKYKKSLQNMTIILIYIRLHIYKFKASRKKYCRMHPFFFCVTKIEKIPVLGTEKEQTDAWL